MRPCHRPPPDRCPDQGVNAVSNKGYAFFHYADASVTDTCIAALHGFQAPYRLTTPRLLLPILLTDEVVLRFLSHLPTNDYSPPLSPHSPPQVGNQTLTVVRTQDTQMLERHMQQQQAR